MDPITIGLAIVAVFGLAYAGDKSLQREAEKWNREHPDDPKTAGDFVDFDDAGHRLG